MIKTTMTVGVIVGAMMAQNIHASEPNAEAGMAIAEIEARRGAKVQITSMAQGLHATEPNVKMAKSVNQAAESVETRNTPRRERAEKQSRTWTYKYGYSLGTSTEPTQAFLKLAMYAAEKGSEAKLSSYYMMNKLAQDRFHTAIKAISKGAVQVEPRTAVQGNGRIKVEPIVVEKFYGEISFKVMEMDYGGLKAEITHLVPEGAPVGNQSTPPLHLKLYAVSLGLDGAVITAELLKHEVLIQPNKTTQRADKLDRTMAEAVGMFLKEAHEVATQQKFIEKVEFER